MIRICFLLKNYTDIWVGPRAIRRDCDQGERVFRRSLRTSCNPREKKNAVNVRGSRADNVSLFTSRRVLYGSSVSTGSRVFSKVKQLESCHGKTTRNVFFKTKFRNKIKRGKIWILNTTYIYTSIYAVVDKCLRRVFVFFYQMVLRDYDDVLSRRSPGRFFFFFLALIRSRHDPHVTVVFCQSRVTNKSHTNKTKKNNIITTDIRESLWSSRGHSKLFVVVSKKKIIGTIELETETHCVL